MHSFVSIGATTKREHESDVQECPNAKRPYVTPQ